MHKMKELLDKLEKRIAAAPKPPRPVGATLFNDNDRDWIREQIRSLRRIYGLDWFVRQELFGKFGIEELSDEELASLLGRIERAVMCIREGVSFEDADLIRCHVEI